MKSFPNFTTNYVAVIICLVFYANAFNIDTRNPIIIKNSADGKDSLFGSTVVLTNETGPGVIVGSPRSNSTLESHKEIFEPGVVWQCSLQKKSEICRVLVMDPTGNVQDPTLTGVTDRKDNGWLGGALVESSETLVTCGSRWSNQHFLLSKEHYFMNGICYWRSKNDIFQDPFPSPANSSRLLPIVDEHYQGKNVWGSGQAGFSIHAPFESHEIIIGAPGIHNWKGGVIKFSNDGRDFFTNQFVMNSSLSNLQLSNDSYLGFTVSSGDFKRDGNRHYVSGAPRGNNLKGQVVIFKIPSYSNGEVDILKTLSGNQFGSYFGSSLCVSDVNGDGYDDLLVGAPRQKHVMLGKALTPINTKSFGLGNGDEGSVFVYLNNQGIFSQFLEINGRLPWGQFGTSISNLGDINGDKYMDVAIAAPYAHSGSGVVYIYYGSVNGLSKKTFQTIQASDIDTGLKGFGYSLSPGKDIDRNGYNDLAIGAYDSGHVVILRTRPVITATGSVLSKTNRLPFDILNFDVESCLQYSGRDAPSNILITVKLMIDVQSKPERVLLQIPNERNRSEYEYTDTYYAGKSKCTTFTAVVVRPLETSGKPVVIKQELFLNQTSEPLTQKTTFEITRFGGQINTRVSGAGYNAFCKDCPLIDSSSTKLKDLQLPLAVSCGDDDICNSDLKLEASFVDIQDNQFVIGSSPVLGMKIDITNFGETAISPVVIIQKGSRKMRKNLPECKENTYNEKSSELECSLGRTLEKEKSKTITLEFEMSDLYAGMTSLNFHILVNTASDKLYPEPTEKTLVLKLKSILNFFISGSTSSHRFNLETMSETILFSHDYEIGISGPTPISASVTDFYIPISVEHSYSGKTKIDVGEPKTSGSVECKAITGMFKNFNKLRMSKRINEDDDEDNPDFTESSNVYPSTTEDLSDALKVSGAIWRRSGGQLSIDCNSSQAVVKCMHVECKIDFLNPGAASSVIFPLRLKSSDIKNLFKKSKFSSLKFTSTGSARILETNDSSDGISVSIIDQDVAKPVSHLIYLLGIFLGFFILAIIAYCLYRAGIFEKKKPPKPEEPESLPLQGVEKEDIAEDEDVDNEKNE